MEFKRLISHFTYRIEPKPEGGFIARASDPTLPPLEAPTREELNQKIQANISASLASEFPQLKLPTENRELKFAFHIESKPDGGFAIHSADPNAQPIEGTSHEEMERHFAEKLITFAGKHFMPELAQALAAQGNSGDVKVFVTRKTGFTTKKDSYTLSGSAAALPTAGSIQSDDARIEVANPADPNINNANFGGVADTIGGSPIIPETNKSWPILRFFLTLLIVAALMYFFLHRH